MRKEEAKLLNSRIKSYDIANLRDLLTEALSASNYILSGPKKNEYNFTAERTYHAFLLMQKIMLHGFSILKLSEGLVIPTNQIFNSKTIQEPFSLIVLHRALLETYLTMHLINFNETAARNDLFHKLWLFCGLRQRQKINYQELIEEASKVLLEDKKEMDRLEINIKSTDEYNSLSEKSKNELFEYLKRDWKIAFIGDRFNRIGWQAILDTVVKDNENAKKLFEGTYNYLSWSAHSQSISIFQLNEFNDGETVNLHVANVLREAILFISFGLSNIVKIEPNLFKYYEEISPLQKNMINFYNHLLRGKHAEVEDIYK